MKLLKRTTIACTVLLLTVTAGIAQDSARPELQKKIEAIAAQHKGALAMYAENLNTGETVAINADTEVPTASVIKLTVLFEALEQVRAHKATFEDTVALKKEDQVGGSGILQFFDTPHQLTLKDVLTMMIVMSDNTATNLAIDHLGLQNIDSRIAWMGLKHTYLYKKVMRPATGPMPADQEKFGLGKTTPREMAQVMERIYYCELSNPGETTRQEDMGLCEIAMKMLREQFYRNAAPRYLEEMKTNGKGPTIGNKTGSLDKVRNDVALVASVRGPIVISAFTYDNEDTSWTADNKAEITIANLAREIVRTWSPEGLAPDDYKPAPRAHPAANGRTH